MMGVIDRFEGEFAVVELDSGEIIDIEKRKIPNNAKEGDVINIHKNITINIEETKKREREIEKLLDNMWEN